LNFWHLTINVKHEIKSKDAESKSANDSRVKVGLTDTLAKVYNYLAIAHFGPWVSPFNQVGSWVIVSDLWFDLVFTHDCM